ncbi:glycosyltransferase [Brenneria populi subsp. brevivirga]|uniref:glycosyltransferase n=1 Tax=Brenneria populi TaxID=1505588 RepID=UPI002E1851FB|nr:glycosyltransferase [Brenneria populi subsp. brevivirga]
MYSINITTTSSRTELCSATVWSLINQSVTPKNINIWVSKEPYLSDAGISDIPEWVDELNKIKNIVRFKFTENTGPYRKVLPALRTANDDESIVYADDDVIYGRLWLENIINIYHKYNKENIVASRVRLIKNNFFNRKMSYLRYEVCLNEKTLKDNFIITGIGGCILSKKHIKENLLYNDDYKYVAPKTDDIWISKIIELSKTKVTCAPLALDYIFEIDHTVNALNQDNNYHAKKRNFLLKLIDGVFIKIVSYFGCKISKNDMAIEHVNSYFLNSSENNF